MKLTRVGIWDLGLGIRGQVFFESRIPNPEPRLGRSRGPFAPLRPLAARSLAFARYVATRTRVAQPKSLAKTVRTSVASRGFELPASRIGQGRRQLNKVENTGLEPVTSWLQTRRSPS